MQKDVVLRLSPQKASDESIVRKALHLGKGDTYLIRKRSVDARRSDVMIDLVCTINPDRDIFQPVELHDTDPSKGQVIIVGSGPAGLFAALTLLENGIKPIILERGKDVHERRQDIAKISTQDYVNPQSNYSFGEGGAGTYSDGKLYTRSKKRGENSKVLNYFVQFGADRSILFDAHPHIGTDKLPKVVENMRNAIISHGGEVHFSTQMTGLCIEGSCVKGCIARDLKTGSDLRFDGPVILAIGNASRDTFKSLVDSGVFVQAKSLAMGVRLEHPQHLIDQIQYHNPAGRGQYLPAAEYSFATQVHDSSSTHADKTVGVYSFCMCPGGFVVPAASDDEQVVVNGMSPSTRGSKWANSGMVVEFSTEMLGDEQYVKVHPLAMMEVQQKLEKATFEASGRTQKAPAVRMTDFLRGKVSQDLPASSYSPGLTCSEIDGILPKMATDALREGFSVFGSQASGFITEQAILIGTETRTSSPVRIERDDESLESVSHANLYPCGEGAGYAGGIVSAAVDGIRCALKIVQKLEN